DGQAVAPQQGPDGQRGADGHVLGLASDGAGGDVGLAGVVGDPAGAEPGGDGAAALGGEHAREQQGEPGGGRLVRPTGQGEGGAGQKGGQVQEWHGRLLDPGPPQQGSSCPRSRPSPTRPPQSYYSPPFKELSARPFPLADNSPMFSRQVQFLPRALRNRGGTKG